MTLLRFLLDFYVPRRLPDARPETLRNYLWTFHHFARYLGREAMLSDLTEQQIGGLMQSLNDGHHAPATVNRVLYCLVALARLAFHKRLLEEYPELRPLRDFHRPPVAWREEELVRLFSAVSHFRPLRKIGGIPARLWWAAFLRTAYCTGGRRGALLSLPMVDVDFSTGAIRFRAELSKTGVEELHHVPLECLTALRAIQKPARELVFPDSRNMVSFFKDWDRLLKWAGLPGGRMNKTQKLRRSAATAAEIQRAGAGQTMLGHATAATTKDHYLDQSLLGEREVVLAVPCFDGELPF
jgi:integrase